MSSKDHLRRASKGLEFALDYASPRERRHFRRAFWHRISSEERQRRKGDSDYLVIDSVVERNGEVTYKFADGSVVSIAPPPDNLFSLDDRSNKNEIIPTIRDGPTIRYGVEYQSHTQSQPQVRRVLYTTESHSQHESRAEDGPVGYFRMRAVQRDLERRLGHRLTQDHFRNNNQAVSVIGDWKLVELPQGSYTELPAAQDSQRTDVIPHGYMLLMATPNPEIRICLPKIAGIELNSNPRDLKRIIESYLDSPDQNNKRLS